MGRWATLHTTAGPKPVVLGLSPHPKLVESGEERPTHDSRTPEKLSK